MPRMGEVFAVEARFGLDAQKMPGEALEENSPVVWYIRKLQHWKVRGLKSTCFCLSRHHRYHRSCNLTIVISAIKSKSQAAELEGQRKG